MEQGTHCKLLPALNNKIAEIPKTYVRYKVEYQLPLLTKITLLNRRCKDICLIYSILFVSGQSRIEAKRLKFLVQIVAELSDKLEKVI